VTLTAQGIGGSGPYEYKFWIKKEGGPWVAVQGYSTANSYTWDTSAYAGVNSIQVFARNVGSSANFEAFSPVKSYTVVATPTPPTSVTVTMSPGSPQAPFPEVSVPASQWVFLPHDKHHGVFQIRTTRWLCADTGGKACR